MHLPGPVRGRPAVRVTAATGMIDVHSSNGPATIEAAEAIATVATSSGEMRFDGSLAGG